MANIWGNAVCITYLHVSYTINGLYCIRNNACVCWWEEYLVFSGSPAYVILAQNAFNTFFFDMGAGQDQKLCYGASHTLPMHLAFPWIMEDGFHACSHSLPMQCHPVLFHAPFLRWVRALVPPPPSTPSPPHQTPPTPVRCLSGSPLSVSFAPSSIDWLGTCLPWVTWSCMVTCPCCLEPSLGLAPPTIRCGERQLQIAL